MKRSQKEAMLRRALGKLQQLVALQAQAAALQLEIVTEGRAAFEMLLEEREVERLKWRAEERRLDRAARSRR